MILPVTAKKKRRSDEIIYIVTCPKTGDGVDTFQACQECRWLSIRTTESVRCRWTKEKEMLASGRLYYDTI